MTSARTLMQLAGADLSPASLRTASLLLIDYQNEYLEGPVALQGAVEAVDNAQRVVIAARQSGTPIIHVAHSGKSGGLFDRSSERGQFIEALAPAPGETVVEKGLPNAFADTNLHSLLTSTERNDVIVCGFMTHMCVSSTARAALDHKYRVTIDAQCCATRDLPDGRGGSLSADTIHETSLVELSDRFAVVAWDGIEQ